MKKIPLCEVALVSRLANWKFKQASDLIADDQDLHNRIDMGVRHTIYALARQYGDVGWALGGDNGAIVQAVLNGMIEET